MRCKYVGTKLNCLQKSYYRVIYVTSLSICNTIIKKYLQYCFLLKLTIQDIKLKLKATILNNTNTAHNSLKYIIFCNNSSDL